MEKNFGAGPEGMGTGPWETGPEDAMKTQEEFQKQCDELEKEFLGDELLSPAGRTFMLSEVVKVAHGEAARAGVSRSKIEIYKDILQRVNTEEYSGQFGRMSGAESIDMTGRFSHSLRGPILAKSPEQFAKLSQDAIDDSEKKQIVITGHCIKIMRGIIGAMRDKLPGSDEDHLEIASFGIE